MAERPEIQPESTGKKPLAKPQPDGGRTLGEARMHARYLRERAEIVEAELEKVREERDEQERGRYAAEERERLKVEEANEQFDRAEAAEKQIGEARVALEGKLEGARELLIRARESDDLTGAVVHHEAVAAYKDALSLLATPGDEERPEATDNDQRVLERSSDADLLRDAALCPPSNRDDGGHERGGGDRESPGGLRRDHRASGRRRVPASECGGVRPGRSGEQHPVVAEPHDEQPAPGASEWPEEPWLVLGDGELFVVKSEVAARGFESAGAQIRRYVPALEGEER